MFRSALRVAAFVLAASTAARCTPSAASLDRLYGEAQQEAWAAAAGDEDGFGKKLAGELTLIATLGLSRSGVL